MKRSENADLRKHNKCREVTLENNKFRCIFCEYFDYSVLIEDDESICIYLPELNGVFGYFVYDYNILDSYYNVPDYKETNPDLDYFYKYFFYKYFKNRFSNCIEVINLGSKNNPLYSCVKCSNSENLVIEENNNIGYCIKYYWIDNYNEAR